MSTQTFFRPFQREHQHLEAVANGKKHVVIDMEKIKDLADGDPADELAQEIYEAELGSQGTFKAFISVQEPRMVGEHWVVHKVLSEKGDQAYQALKAGILWDYKLEIPDYPATTQYYRDMMAKGQIEMRFVDLLVDTKTDELKDLRSELVYFKLRGSRKGDVIHGMSDAQA